MSDELPKGWAVASISELCDVVKEKGREGVVPYLEIGNVDIASKCYVLADKPSVKGGRVARKDDVLVSKVRPTRGAITWIRENELQVSSAFTVLRSKGALAEKCLWQFLAWNRNYLNHLGENCTGTMYPTTSDEAVVDFQMPLPPLSEQRQIVAKLETLLGKVDASQQRLAKMPVLLKRFRQSVLAAACSGRLTADWREENSTEEHSEATRKTLLDAGNEVEVGLHDTPDSWVWTSLDRVCSKITDGEHLTPPVTERGVPLLSAKDVRDNHLDFSDTKFVTEEFAKKSRTRCNPEQGDILVVSRGATVGRTCRVQVAGVFCLMGSVLLFKPDGRYVLPQMIEFCFKSQSGLAALIATSSSTAQQAIYIKDMRSFALPIPPLPEQQEIVRRVEGLFALADQLEMRLAQARGQVCKLTPSLLARAFAGKLVPQDPNDEPTSALLERIRKEGPRIARMTRMKKGKENP